MTAEISCRLQTDATALQRFYQWFGFDYERMRPTNLQKIGELFPDTPVTLLRDVFEKLQLYDLVELLDKIKPRTLRPAFPLKEMENLLNASERPTKFYSKAEVLIIEYYGNEVGEDSCVKRGERIGSFFHGLNSQSQVNKVTAKIPDQLLQDLKRLTVSEHSGEVRRLRQRKGRRVGGQMASSTNTNKQQLSKFTKEEPVMKIESPEKVTKEKQQRNLELEKIRGEIKQKEEELKRELVGEKEKFQMAVSAVMDKWICQANDEG